MRKAFISGMGCVSAAGSCAAETLEQLFREPHAPAMPPAFTGSSLDTPVFTADTPLETRQGENRSLALLRKALAEALADSGLDAGIPEGIRAGAAAGTTVAAQMNDLYFYKRFRDGEKCDIAPIRDFLNGNPAETVKRELHLSGPALTVSNACASGADAVALAAMWVRSGRCDIAFACGLDELNRIPIAGFNSLGVASQEHCRPFDALRSGLNLGEGAGVVIIESEASLKRRGRSASVSVAGVGESGDAWHITAPRPDGSGLEKAVRAALVQAELTPPDIAFVNAHGTGTLNNDPAEASALARIFGKDLRYHSTKSQTGHTLGAAGTLEFIFTVMMLMERKAAPSFRFENLPPDIPLPPITETCALSKTAALSTSLAFGGCNTALVALLEKGGA